MTNSTDRALVAISVTGWRIWDLLAGESIAPEDMNRGVVIVLDRDYRIVPDADRQIAGRELSMILDGFEGLPISFHLRTEGDETYVPQALESLMSRYPGLAGRTIHIDKKLHEPACEKLLVSKAKHNLRFVLHHHTVIGYDAWHPAVRLADQVMLDVGRGKPNFRLDERTVGTLRLLTTVTKVPIGITGRLSSAHLDDLEPQIVEMKQMLRRPVAFETEVTLKPTDELDLGEVAKWAEVGVHSLTAETSKKATSFALGV